MGLLKKTEMGVNIGLILSCSGGIVEEDWDGGQHNQTVPYGRGC